MNEKEIVINEILDSLESDSELIDLEEKLGLGWEERLDNLADRLRKLEFIDLLKILKGD